ncbi:ribonuclease P protein component [Amphiplicatus metriothermophilus]|uniref:ribonuclease P protein component n=1 Tax=Amphiplicatus metriothermophilus TaxID=1519374 RepID=UPI00389935F0
MRKKADFQALRGAARRGTASFLLVRRRREDGDPAIGVGFAVTKKLGKAVLRNRIRRRLREACRRVMPVHGEPGCDYLLVARAGAATRPWARLLDDLKRALLSHARAST